MIKARLNHLEVADDSVIRSNPEGDSGNTVRVVNSRYYPVDVGVGMRSVADKVALGLLMPLIVVLLSPGVQNIVRGRLLCPGESPNRFDG